jgi:hypothetical protein
MPRLLFSTIFFLFSLLAKANALRLQTSIENALDLRWKLLVDPVRFREEFCLRDEFSGCHVEAKWRLGSGEWVSICDQGDSLRGLGRYWRITQRCDLHPTFGKELVLTQTVFR